MSSYTKLIKNSAIFTIANLGSKLLSFILVPYYTYVLTTEQLGEADALVNIVALILPIVSLNIQDGVLRFTMDKDKEPVNILNIGLKTFLINFLIISLAFPILLYFGLFKEYLIYLYLILLFQGLYSILGQYLRGIGCIKEFAIGGVINTFVLLTCNIFLLMFMKIGVAGYLISFVMSYLVSCLYFVIIGKLWRYKIFSKIDKLLAKDIIFYCIPLIPNALMWWIMNISDRYMIIYFMGLSASGIYTVAHKIPTIINLISSIFGQAWQISAIEEKDSENKDNFYSQVFNYYALVIFGACLSIIAISRPLLNAIIEKSYMSAVECIPFLMVSMVFSSFGTFLGTIYAAEKKTASAMISTLLGALINILFNAILIPILGLNGAALGTMIGLFILWIYRLIDTRKFVKIKYDKLLMFSFLVVLFIEICLYYSNLKSTILNLILTVVFLIINYKMFYKVIRRLLIKISTR